MRRKPCFIAITALLTLLLALAGCGKPNTTATPIPETETATPAPTTELPSPTPQVSDEPAAFVPTPEPQETSAKTPAVAVTVINVGYGDSILVQLGGQNYLIDTGAKKAGEQLLSALAARGVTRLDGVFLTHTHDDHIGGLETVAQRYDIGTLYAADITQDQDKIDKLSVGLGLKLNRLFAGDVVKTDSGAAFEILGPLVYNADDDNDNSLVMRLKAGGLVWLFTGDMQFSEEQSLMNAGAGLKADVLKVGNHGNPDATSDDFGKTVSPQAAVISTSTEEDNDSANARVKNALSGSQIYVTQDYTLGVLLTAENGELKVADQQPQPFDSSVEMSVDVLTQTVTLVSDSKMDISDWYIWSEKGGEFFVFPQGATLKAGEPLTVVCRGGKGDFLWDEKKVWKDKDDEAGVLFTSGGAVAARDDNL